MHESYDDNKFYFEEGYTDEIEDFNIVICNYSEIIMKYDYTQYVKRFRIMAKHYMLQSFQRPKLTERDFNKQLQSLKDFLETNDEKELLHSQKRITTIQRLLLQKKLEEW